MASVSYSINQKNLIAEISASEPVLKRVIDPVVKESFFDPAVEQLKKDFEEDLVTQEIAGGLDSSNISETLEGSFRGGEGNTKANLWGFIGFDAAGGSPGEVLGPIRQRLDPRHPEGPKLRYIGRDKSKMAYTYEIRAPNSDAIDGETPVPWLNGISWTKRIEQGLSGLGQFLNVSDRQSSRSGGGIQIEAQLRSGRFKARPYLSRMFNNFLRRAAGRKANGRTIEG